MRFPLKFSRWKGSAPAGAIAIGADAVPTSAPTGAEDHVLQHRPTNAQGWPVQRIIVMYKAPSGTLPVAAQLFFYEAESDAWYLLGGSKVSIVPGVAYAFDAIALIEKPATAANQMQATPGSDALCLLTTDPFGVANGEHIFLVGADLTATEETVDDSDDVEGFVASATGFYPKGIAVMATGTITFAGKDGISTGSVTVPAALRIPGPLTVSATGTATFLGLK